VKNTTVVDILFIALTMTTCFGRAWSSAGHKLLYITGRKRINERY
jgi:hypothetical protein